ncbi:MAG: PIG-L family deacetylase [Anaerolineales bacterium]|nr:MAG: PIG-L family deacetylase [Anaerolineales bacterium]
MVAHLYLSPHLDDAVFSCGGLMAMQDARGEPISVLTVFAGDPPDYRISAQAAELHARWGKAGPPIAMRRAEDRVACARLGASVLHLEYADAIYRADEAGRPLYPETTDLFRTPDTGESELMEQLEASMRELEIPQATIYCPLGFGGHVDHRITRRAAEKLGQPLNYYADFPYAARGHTVPPELGEPSGTWRMIPVGDDAIEAWVSAIGEYQTQLSSFWEDEASLYQEVRDFHDAFGGLRIMQPNIIELG